MLTPISVVLYLHIFKGVLLERSIISKQQHTIYSLTKQLVAVDVIISSDSRLPVILTIKN